MTTTRYRLYTGPTLTQHVANVLLLNGAASVFEGTAHVYFDSPLDRFAAWLYLLNCGLTGYKFTEFTEAHRAV
jgi:hypothetical protein